MQPRFNITPVQGRLPQGVSRACAAGGRDRGFTLLELMATITILAILLGIGIPSLTAFIQNSRVTSQANGLVSSFHLARSEAIKRGVQVTVEARPGGFEAGWCVHFGADCADTNNVIREYPPMARISVPVEDAVVFSFDARGARVVPAGGPVQITLQPADCSTGQANRARSIVVTATGRPGVNREACL